MSDQRAAQKPKKRRILRKYRWSDEQHELPDEDLVKKAKARANSLPFSIEDLYDSFGIDHNFFWRSIAFNSIIWALAEVQYVIAKQVTLTSKDFEFHGADKKIYSSRRPFSSFDFGEDMKANLELINNLSQIVGPMYILFRYNVERRRQMLEACILYCLSSLLLIPDYMPMIKIGMTLTMFFNKSIRYVALMHLSESVPPKLLPLAMGVMGVCDCLSEISYSVVLLYIENWRYNSIGLGLIIGIFGIIYRLAAPAPILLCLVLKQGTAVQGIIEDELGDPDIIDVDALIDDTIFTGRATVGHWTKAWKLLRVPNFLKKYLYLITLLQLSFFSCEYTFGTTLSLGKSETQLIKIFIRGFASLLGIGFLYRFGHRMAIAFHVLISIEMLAILCSVRLEGFDICSMASVPSWKGKLVAVVAGAILEYCSRTLKIVIRMIFIQHILVEQHTILFIAEMVIQNFSKEALDFSLKRWNLLNWSFYPYGQHLITLLMTCLLTPAILPLDNCPTMPLISTDYQAYHFSRKPWNDQPRLADDEQEESFLNPETS